MKASVLLYEAVSLPVEERAFGSVTENDFRFYAGEQLSAWRYGR